MVRTWGLHPEIVHESDVDPTIAEADDICAVIAVYVGKLAGILIIVHPAPGTDGEIVQLEGGLCKVSLAGGECDNDSAIAETHNIGHRSEEHTSELQSLAYLVCRLLLEKKKTNIPPALFLLAQLP